MTVYWVDLMGDAALDDAMLTSVNHQDVVIEIRRISCSLYNGKAYMNISGHPSVEGQSRSAEIGRCLPQSHQVGITRGGGLLPSASASHLSIDATARSRTHRRQDTMNATTITWPASYLGVGLAILTLPDGTYQGVTENGYCSASYADAQAAFVDVTAHIAAQGGK